MVLVLGSGVYAYFHLKNNKKPKREALSVLPDHCSFYLNTTNFFELNKKINSQSLIADKLKMFGDIDRVCSFLQAFDSLVSTEENLREAIEDNIIHFAGYKEKNGWLATFSIKQLGRQDDIAEYMASVLKATKGKGELYSFKLKKLPLYFNLSEGVAALSNSENLILRSLDKTEPKLEKNPAFSQFKSTLSENGLLSLFVDHARYAESPASSLLNLSYSTKKGYSSGAVAIQPSQLKINGYLEPGEEDVISFFREQNSQPTKTVFSNLPSGTRFIKAFGFSSYPDLRVEFPLTRVHIRYWMNANERGLYNVENEFHENIINHIIAFENFSANKFISAEIQDTIKAAENLKFMSDSVFKKDSLIVYRLNDSIVPLRLFVALSENPTNFAVLFQSHIFFADKAEHLLQLVNDFRNNRYLLNDESFSLYQNQHFPDDFNYLVYAAPNQMGSDISAFFNFKADAPGSAFNPSSSGLRHFSYTVTRHDNLFKFRCHLLNESEKRSKEQNVLWTLRLDSVSSMRPWGFINHTSGENEIVIQDDNNVLYLINAKGTVLWKKELSEKILSAIYTVDIYKKNKYQMLFNTKNHLHLIDRNGKYVETFPIKLPAEASSEMSLFDYDGNKDYRIFIPCTNRSIYNFNIHGTFQEKFAIVKTDDEVVLPIQYVNVGKSDYLVALDKEGKIYTFSRKGAGRIGLVNRATINCKTFYTDAGGSTSSSFLVYVDDKNGLINKISFEDKKEIVKLHAETENAVATFNLVDNNRSMDLILTRGNQFHAYNFSGNLILEKTCDIELGVTHYYGDESHSVFYSLSADKTTLLVFDQLHSRSRSFHANALPLISNLFNDNKKYLIIPNGRQVDCVLLN